MPLAHHYAESLRAYREYDDKWALAFLVEDIGQLAAMSGQPERAFELVGAADTLREEIGTPALPGSKRSSKANSLLHGPRFGDAAAPKRAGHGRALHAWRMCSSWRFDVCDTDPASLVRLSRWFVTFWQLWRCAVAGLAAAPGGLGSEHRR